jgi:hypothetical protein
VSTKIKTFGVTKFLAKTEDFRSYEDAHALVDWLNEAPQERWRKRAIRLIETLRAVNGLPLSDYVSVGRQLDEIRRLIAPLRKLRWDYARRYSPNQFWYIDQTPAGDFHGLLRVARLSSHGLDLVRRCEGPNCPNWQEWFIAQKGNNVFCSDACRENAWNERRKTPEGRAARAKYMRDRRATLKKLAPKRKLGA